MTAEVRNFKFISANVTRRAIFTLYPALIGLQTKIGITRVDRRTVRLQRISERRTAVICQWGEFGVDVIFAVCAGQGQARVRTEVIASISHAVAVESSARDDVG